MKKTAIILVTKDRFELLQQTINSLLLNTPTELYDLIVIDDGSKPDCIDYLNGLKAGEIIKDLVFTELGSPARCRNVGAEIAKRRGYEYLYHTDNDIYFLEGWLEECIRVKENFPEIKIIGAYCHPFLQKNEDFEFNDKIETVDAVSGNSWFISTVDFLAYGLEDTQGIMASEDWAFCQKIRYPIDSIDPNKKVENFVVRLKPHRVLHTGISNSKGEPAIGADIMIEELSEAKIKHGLNDLIYN